MLIRHLFLPMLSFMFIKPLQTSNETKSLAEDLRRKLKYNNYDYVIADDDTKPSTVVYTLPKEVFRIQYGDDTILPNNSQIREKGDEVLKEIDTSSTTVATKKILTIFKLKNKSPYRRSGGVSYRRVLQEETENGVSLIDLDAHPIAQIRLPRNRRQYMDKDYSDYSVDTDEESPFKYRKVSGFPGNKRITRSISGFAGNKRQRSISEAFDIIDAAKRLSDSEIEMLGDQFQYEENPDENTPDILGGDLPAFKDLTTVRSDYLSYVMKKMATMKTTTLGLGHFLDENTPEFKISNFV